MAKNKAAKKKLSASTVLPPGQQIPKKKSKSNKPKQGQFKPKKEKKQNIPNPAVEMNQPTHSRNPQISSSIPRPTHQLPPRPHNHTTAYQSSKPPPRPQSPQRYTDYARHADLPRRPSIDPQPYQFGGGDSYRPSNGHALPERRPDNRMQFSMNAPQQAPIPSAPRFPMADAHTKSESHRRRDGPRHPGKHRGNGHRDFSRRGPPPAHDRAILRSVNRPREATPERLAGMVGGAFRFKAQDEMSESMSESESDSDRGSSNKRRKVIESDKSNRPQWCNPDPYSALPPTYEPAAKKKDVVQLIRKAKEAVQTQVVANNSIADNEDFVSLAFSDDEEDQIILPHNRSHTDATAKVRNVPSPPIPPPPPPQKFNAFEAPEARIPLPPRPLDSLPNPRKRKLVKLGEITTEWAASGGNATPWKQPNYAPTNGMTWRLHQEMLDFHAWVKPMPFENRIREHLIKRIEETVCTGEYRNCSIRAFGSFPSGLYLPTADMDLVLVSRNYEQYGTQSLHMTANQMRRILSRLQAEGIARAGAGAGATVIAKAKVPIIKFIDDQTGLHVDISFENLTGVVANTTYSTWKNHYPDMTFLVCIVKQFLLMRNLNEVFSGGLGGFSITCLVVSFLQLEASPGSNSPPRNLGELLIDFFEFYGRKFKMVSTQISMNPPQHWPKPAKVRQL